MIGHTFGLKRWGADEHPPLRAEILRKTSNTKWTKGPERDKDDYLGFWTSGTFTDDWVNDIH